MQFENTSKLTNNTLDALNFEAKAKAKAKAKVKVKVPGEQLPSHVVKDLRTDHAGEMGAVYIYKAILIFSRDRALRHFAERHLTTEQSHLQRIEDWLAPKHFSKLIDLWKVAGFITGAIPALFGPRAVYATIKSVETFVDLHYEEQVLAFKTEPELSRLLDTLKECQADEVDHRDQASLAIGDSKLGIFLRTWCALVSWGSKNAVNVCRYI